MPRSDKWQLGCLAVMIMGGIMVVTADAMGDEGSVSVWWLLLFAFNIGVQCWDLDRKRRKRRDLRHAWLTHFDRLMRREVKRR